MEASLEKIRRIFEEKLTEEISEVSFEDLVRIFEENFSKSELAFYCAYSLYVLYLIYEVKNEKT